MISCSSMKHGNFRKQKFTGLKAIRTVVESEEQMSSNEEVVMDEDEDGRRETEGEVLHQFESQESSFENVAEEQDIALSTEETIVPPTPLEQTETQQPTPNTEHRTPEIEPNDDELDDEFEEEEEIFMIRSWAAFMLVMILLFNIIGFSLMALIGTSFWGQWWILWLIPAFLLVTAMLSTTIINHIRKKKAGKRNKNRVLMVFSFILAAVWMLTSYLNIRKVFG